MPMSFGTSCEPSQEATRAQRRRRRLEERKSMPERMDAFERIVGLCSIRDRSAMELRNRLKNDGYDEGVVESALERALSCGLVDDERFADAFIRGKVSAGKGLRAIYEGLAEHGIQAESLDGWPESYGLDDMSQVKRAVDFLSAYPPRAKDMWGAGYRKLISRGYSAGIASKATRIWAESRGVN